MLGNIEAAKEIRLFGIGDHLRDLMRVERRAINAVQRRVQVRSALIQGLPTLLAAGITAAGLIWAVRAASAGQLSVGDVSMFVAGIAAVQGGIGSMVLAVSVSQHHLLLFQHYLAVVESGPDLPVREPIRPMPALSHGIELRDVWFRYSPDHPWVLRGVSLTIPFGRSVGLVGLNGAGKSTLVKLLCRFYDPTRGAVLWDGVDLRSLPIDELRHRVSAIFQDFMAYDLSATQNIGFGDLSGAGDRTRIRRAAGSAGIDAKLTSLPRGYDTLLTRMFAPEPDGTEESYGVVLSGGEWQRVALARAFLREAPELLIMDEPTAGLDPDAEHEIHEAAQRYRLHRTSLLISHRLNTIRDADRIVVLHDGRVVEQGDHAELLAAGARYASLFAKQAAGYEMA